MPTNEKRKLSLIVLALLLSAGCGSSDKPSIYNITNPEDLGSQADNAVGDVLEDSFIPDNLLPDGNCIPDCQNRACGNDGCGNSCGECEEGTVCIADAEAANCKRQNCEPGERKCDGSRILECNDFGTGFDLAGDCALSSTQCVDGECVDCTPDCGDRLCGDDGCGGSCGECDAGDNCIEGRCLIPCESPQCQMAKFCALSDGTEALCGGVIDCGHSLQGGTLGNYFNIESMYNGAGVLFYTDTNDSVVTTNNWELASQSKGSSCASLDDKNNPWRDAVQVRFVLPKGSVNQQGATHYVALYIGQTWPDGIAVEYYPPETPPGSGQPFHTSYTQSEGTAFVEYFSDQPIGYVKIRAADDPDFTMDDFEFGPIYHP